jgi:hypothetical protein
MVPEMQINKFLSKLSKVPKSTSHARDPISLPPGWAPVQIVHTVAYTLYRLCYPPLGYGMGYENVTTRLTGH